MARPNRDNSKFQRLRYSQIATPPARELTLLECPAVYAWYRDLRFGPALDDPDAFLAHVEELMNARLSSRFRGKLGFLYEITIEERSSGFSAKKHKLLQALSQDPSTRRSLAEVLEKATHLMSPLYIGKATNLRSRVAEHVSGSNSDLRERLQEAGIGMQSCQLRYAYIEITFKGGTRLLDPETSQPLNATPSDVVTLVEDILTRISPAAFVRRPG